MNRRTSLAGVEELKHAFEQANLSLQNDTYSNSKSSSIFLRYSSYYVDKLPVGISDSEDSEDSDDVCYYLVFNL